MLSTFVKVLALNSMFSFGVDGPKQRYESKKYIKIKHLRMFLGPKTMIQYVSEKNVELKKTKTNNVIKERLSCWMCCFRCYRLEGWRMADRGIEQLTGLLPAWTELRKIR